MAFPNGFVWGTAASAYQIEGAAAADGKGKSVWDMFCRRKGRIWRGQTGEVACDHYHRYAEDVALMKRIGLKAYRLSISWPRILPAGTGQVNKKALVFYDRLIDELLAAGIAPWVTLFHWDYPYDLYCRGGWLNPDSPDWFADYTRAVVDQLSDRVSCWLTLNEPQCFIGMGHQQGTHAPGVKLDLPDVLRASHHTLLAHGKSVQVIRARAKSAPQVGWAPVGCLSRPATTDPADIAAAERASFAVDSDSVFNTAWWSDPVFLGEYPADGVERYGDSMPLIAPDDMETISQPLDFYGINLYQGGSVRAGDDGEPAPVPPAVGEPITLYEWSVTPEALYWAVRFCHRRYGKPIVVTENGLSCMDWVALDGRVHDPQRIDFTQRYLRKLARAIDDGVDVRGYFHWSILDNFEWNEGYKHRFGLVHVDFQTLKRTMKDSASWYGEVIHTNGQSL